MNCEKFGGERKKETTRLHKIITRKNLVKICEICGSKKQCSSDSNDLDK